MPKMESSSRNTNVEKIVIRAAAQFVGNSIELPAKVGSNTSIAAVASMRHVVGSTDSCFSKASRENRAVCLNFA